LMRRQSFHIGILSQPFDVRRQLLPRWLAVDPGGIQRRMPQKRRQHDDVCRMLGQIIVGEGMPKRRRLLKWSTKGGSGCRLRSKTSLFFPLLLYHLLSTRTLPFWTIFFGVLSPILRWKRRASFAPALKAELSAKIALVFVLKKPRLHQACARPSSCAKGVTER
jgi:hypothetical protein